MTEESDALAAFMRASDAGRMECLEQLLKDVVHERVRDFVVAEGIKQIPSPCVIIHIPSGNWKGFKLPYDQAVQMLKDKPDSDADLLESIFAV